MKEIDKSKPVAVTGGTGYIASWIVKYLLDKGINVKTSVRNKSDRSKYEHLLKAAENSSAVLTIFEADLLKPGSFDELVKDCELVIHTASPFKIAGVKNFRKEVIEPALEGTRNVLGSVNRTDSVKRVVLTASAATIYGDNADITGKTGGVFTPDDWNTTSTPDHQPYSYSKTIAEKEAWKICGEQNRWDLVTIHPGFVLGPSLTSRTDSTSIDFVMSIMKGQFRAGAPQLWFGTVDVRDVATLHIEAGFNPSAKGRYIAIEDSYSIPEITGIVKSKVGSEYPVSSRKVPGFLMYLAGPMMGFTMKYVKRNLGYKIRFNNSATIRDFNFKFRPIDETLRDHFEQIKRDQLL